MSTQRPEIGENEQDPDRCLVASVDSVNGDAEVEGTPLEASRIRMLQCLVFSLAFVAIGFVTALKDATVYYKEMHLIRPNTSQLPWYKRDNPNLWACMFIKCAQLSMGIGAIFYLQNRVVQPGRIRKARFYNPAMPQQRYTLRNLRQFIELPGDLANYPTTLFISIFIIFAILGAACSLAETIGACINAFDQRIYGVLQYADILRSVLLFLFITMQTAFFVKHNRVCLQWKQEKTMLATSIILSTNLSFWFFYVSQEVSEIVVENKVCAGNSSSSLEQKFREQLKSVAEILFPFLIEFFLMSAILAGSFLSNVGRLSRVLRQIQQQIHCLTTEAIRDRLHIPPGYRTPEGLKMRFRQHSRSLLFGLALVLSALITSVLMKLFVCGKEPWHILSLYILVVSYASGSVCSIVLLRAFRFAGEASVDAQNRTAADRLMLWCGVVAVLVYDLNRFWGVFQSNKRLENSIGTGLVTLLNICQSVLQVYILECILLQRLKSTDIQVGGSRNWCRRLLTTLMLINALEWLISAVAFSLFFFSSSSISSTSLALVVICAPLHVFFRFHSIGCIHEFRKHCKEEGYEPLNPPPSVHLDFPTITPANYGAIV